VQKSVNYLDALKYSGALFVAHETVQAFLVIEAEAEARNLLLSDSDLASARDSFLYERGLHSDDDLDAWMSSQPGLFPEDLERIIRFNATTEQLKSLVYDEPDGKEICQQLRNAPFAANLAVIVVEEPSFAQELLHMISEDGYHFGDVALQHSIHVDTSKYRGQWGPRMFWEIPSEARDMVLVRSAEAKLVGPIAVSNSHWIIRVESLYSLPEDDVEISKDVVFKYWLQARIGNYAISVG